MRPVPIALGILLSAALIGACAALPVLKTSPVEATAFALAGWWIVLLVRQSPWNWLFAILSSGVYLAVFLQNSLFADAGLQLVYIALSIAGWVWWVRGGKERSELPVSRATPALWVVAGLCTALFTVLIGLRLATIPGTLPFWDPFTTALSLVGQYMQARKVYENWFLWIAANACYVGVYLYKGLELTAVLSLVLLALCFAGLREWRQGLQPAASH